MVGTSNNAVTTTLPSDREIVMTRVFNAPRHLVFDAWTKCEHLKRWWNWSMPVCETDLRVGGKWRYLMRGEDGQEMGMHGEYREIEAPDRLVTTEVFEGDWFEPMGSGTINTLLLLEQDGKTTLTWTSFYKSKEARDRVLEFPMEDGVNESFARLDELLQTLSA
jgi:uncharacterized protein YndB with AHSA1/START domain